jgi:hypothetical protein
MSKRKPLMETCFWIHLTKVTMYIVLYWDHAFYC